MITATKIVNSKTVSDETIAWATALAPMLTQTLKPATPEELAPAVRSAFKWDQPP